jgi:hypothetical protein
MKEFFFSRLLDSKRFLYLSILITFSIIAYYNLSIGYVMSPDSFGYSRWADDLIQLNFNLYNYYVHQIEWHTPSYFYTTPVVIIALLKVFFGSGWQYAFLALNLFLVLFSLLLFTKSLLIIGVRPVLISITMAVLVLSVDLLLWPRYMLTDMTFTFLVILASYIVIKGIVEGKFHYLSLISVLVITLISRPSSLPVLFAIFCFIAIARFQIHTKPKLLLLFILSLFVVTPFIFAYLHHLMETNLSENVQAAHILNYADMGMVIHDRPETFVSSPNTFSDFVYLYFLRLIAFFTPYAAKFSTIHIILNSFQTVIILLSITIWTFLGGKIKLIDKTVLFILLLSFSVAAFQAFTVIDYDWRYRFPIILPLMMIFPISMEIILNKIKSD